MTIDQLKPGQIITNKQLCDLFKCSPQGGIRSSVTTNTIVLVANRHKSLYGDLWKGDEVHYTGEGLIGDQQLVRGNKSIHEAASKKRILHFFESFKKNSYTYRGIVELSGEPYKNRQIDSEGNYRLAIMFPLRFKDPSKSRTSSESEEEIFNRELAKAEQISDAELYAKAKSSLNGNYIRNTITKSFYRSPYIAALAKRRARGICQLCELAAPFYDKTGAPFLESHHIIWLSKGGEDSIENTIALCPNCHRKMHKLALQNDVKKLKAIAENIDDFFSKNKF